MIQKHSIGIQNGILVDITTEDGKYVLTKDHEREIAELTEELRLSGLRGDSLDRVIEEGVQKELKLTAERKELTAENNQRKEIEDSLQEEIKRLDAEVGQLREALEKIAAQDCFCSEMVYRDIEYKNPDIPLHEFIAWLFCLNAPDQIPERMKMVCEFIERRK